MPNRKKLFAAAVSVVIAFAMLFTATFAWFSISTNPEISGIHVELFAPGHIKLATKTAPDKFEYTIDLTQDFAGFADLTPVSTVDGINWYIPTYDETTGYPNGDLDLFIWDNTLEYANQSLYEYKDGVLVTTADGSPKYLEGLDLIEAQKKGYYVYTDFWIKAENEENGCTVRLSVPHYGTDEAKDELENTFGTYALGNSIARDTNDDGVLELLDMSNMAQTSLRCGFLVYGDSDNPNTPTDFIIYEPNAEARSATGKPCDAGKTGEYIVGYHLDTTDFQDERYVKTVPVGILYEDDGVTPIGYIEKTITKTRTLEGQYVQARDSKGALLWEQDPVYKQATDKDGKLLFNQLDAYIYNESQSAYIQIYGTVTTNGIADYAENLYIKDKKDETKWVQATDSEGHLLFVIPESAINIEVTSGNTRPGYMKKSTTVGEVTTDSYERAYGKLTTTEGTNTLPFYYKETDDGVNDYVRATNSKGEDLYIIPSTYVTADDITDPIYELDSDKQKIPLVIDGVEVTKNSTRPVYELDENKQKIPVTEEYTQTIQVPKAGLVEIDPDKLIVQRSSEWRYKLTADEAGKTLLDKIKESIGLTSLDVTFGKFLNSDSLYTSLGTSKSIPAPKSGTEEYSLPYTDEETAGSAVIVELNDSTPVKIRLFIWIEGQDIDCWNDIAAGNFTINLELAGYSNDEPSASTDAS